MQEVSDLPIHQENRSDAGLSELQSAARSKNRITGQVLVLFGIPEMPLLCIRLK